MKKTTLSTSSLILPCFGSDLTIFKKVLLPPNTSINPNKNYLRELNFFIPSFILACPYCNPSAYGLVLTNMHASAKSGEKKEEGG